MKILFVCHANIGRSQVAQEFYNSITGEESLSAGCGVNDLQLGKVKDAPYKRSIEFIQNVIGVDISEKYTIQLTKRLVEESDLVIAILEPNQCQSWLIENKNVRWWNIEDTPGLDIEATHKIWHEVIKNVKDLVRELHANSH